MVDTVERDPHGACLNGKTVGWRVMLLAFAHLIDYCRFFLRKASISHDALLRRSNTNRKGSCCLLAYSHLVLFRVEIFDLQLPPLQFLFFEKIGKVDLRMNQMYIRASRNNPSHS